MSSLLSDLGIAIAVFTSTNIDDIFLLSACFADARMRHGSIVAGQYLGIGVLVLASALAALLALALPAACPCRCRHRQRRRQSNAGLKPGTSPRRLTKSYNHRFIVRVSSALLQQGATFSHHTKEPVKCQR